MNIEKQVCSPELGNIIHCLGVVVPSLFYYEWTGATKAEMWENGKPDYCEDNICAYTVAELGELMKGKSGFNPEFEHSSWNGVWKKWDAYIYDGNGEQHHYEEASTEADARAKCLIYLIENKLLDPLTLKV